METKKAILIGFVTLIVIATIAVIAMKAQMISYPGKYPSNNVRTAPASQVQPKAGNSTQTTVQSTETDSDVKAVEDDLNSISEEDFSESNLSNQNLGL